MLKIVCAAALLLSISPAFAAPAPRADKDKPAVSGAVKAQEQTNKAVPQEEASDDDIQVVIMGKPMHVQVPNPYKNPNPRMLTDAWAMRA
jgi:hypothetical protein